MKAMVLKKAGTPLELVNLPVPEPGPGEVLLKVHTCGICRTDLHILDGELTEPSLPLVLGHQIVGTAVKLGSNVKNIKTGDKIGVPWLGGTCRECEYCKSGNENLCSKAVFTGYNVNGGFAEFTVSKEQFSFKLPQDTDIIHTAPLLCGGLIGYRAFTMTETAEKIGMYGFGSAAHIITQAAVYLGKRVFAFTRPGDTEGQRFARKLGAEWAGSSLEMPPEKLDSAIIFAPVGSLVPLALKAVRRGGSIICAGIYMSDIPSFPYKDLWEERSIKSVANLTRKDGEEFLDLAYKVPIRTETETFSLEEANEALLALRNGKIEGSGVIVIRREQDP
jgi:alcohol dehydrogenase, propanol-preferring